MEKLILKAMCLLAIFSATSAATASTIKTKACDGGGEFASFPGSYTVKIQMRDGKIFLDKLRIDTITKRAGMASVIEEVTGEFEVPGVFKTPLINARASSRFITGLEPGVNFDFQGRGKEGGKEFPFFVKLTAPHTQLRSHSCLLTGKIYSPTTSAFDVIGDVAMIKDTTDCICLYGEAPL